MMKAVLTLLIVSTLTMLACGDFASVAAPSVSTAIGACQTAGSTVHIMDQVPGC